MRKNYGSPKDTGYFQDGWHYGVTYDEDHCPPEQRTVSNGLFWLLIVLLIATIVGIFVLSAYINPTAWTAL